MSVLFDLLIIVISSVDNSACLLYLLKFPTLEHLEDLIKSAVDFKIKYNLKKEEVKSPKRKKKSSDTLFYIQDENPHTSTDWISNSIVFFNTIPKVNIPIKDQTSLKEIPSTMGPVKLSVLDKLDSCLDILKKEKEKRSSKKMDKCIKILKEAYQKLK